MTRIVRTGLLSGVVALVPACTDQPSCQDLRACPPVAEAGPSVDAAAPRFTPELVSIGVDGSAPGVDCTHPTASNDGEVAYESTFDPRTPDTPSAGSHVVWFGSTGQVVIGEGGDSSEPSISAEGDRVAFRSKATGLVQGDTNGATDVFVWESSSAPGTALLASVPLGGGLANGPSLGAPSISSDGAIVAFASLATNLLAAADPNVTGSDVFVHAFDSGSTTSPSQALGAGVLSGAPRISAEGSFVAFESTALARTDGGADARQVELAGPASQETVSVGESGPGDGPSMEPAPSKNGVRVAFTSAATNLVGSDGNGAPDVFLRDTLSRQTTRISTAPGGGDPDGSSGSPTISADGRFVAFESSATNLVPGDHNGRKDVFLYDATARTTVRVSVAADGTEANGDSGAPALSFDGNTLVFESTATNLVAGLPESPRVKRIFRVALGGR